MNQQQLQAHNQQQRENQLQQQACQQQARNVDEVMVTEIVSRMGPRFEWAYIMFRLMLHVVNVELPKAYVSPTEDNRELRIKFLINDLDEKGFKKRLAQREKALSRKREMTHIFDMFVTVSQDLLLRLFDTYCEEQANAIRAEFMELFKYFNGSMDTLARCYKSTAKVIRIDCINLKFEFE
jgi:hypothetical protein